MADATKASADAVAERGHTYCSEDGVHSPSVYAPITLVQNADEPRVGVKVEQETGALRSTPCPLNSRRMKNSPISVRGRIAAKPATEPSSRMR